MQIETETDDALKVDEAIKHMQNGNLKEAESILLDVCSRCPDDYQYEYVKSDTRYIKFWDRTEFMGYVATLSEDNKQNIVWLNSAYPRACYHLAFIFIERGDFHGAISWLNKGQSMEPQNPKFFLETGIAYAQMKKHQKSLDCYLQALGIPNILINERAAALRGIGVQLIDLNRLDEAEAWLKDSLELEPDNENAKHELKYISHLKAGNPPVAQIKTRTWGNSGNKRDRQG